MKTFIRENYRKVATNARTALNYSFILALSFAALFLIARLLGLEKFTELRYINYIMFYPIAFAAVRKAYVNNGHKIEYFNGLMTGFLTGALGHLWYCIAFFIYLFADKEFMAYIIQQMPANIIAPQFSAMFILLVEGVGLSAVLSLTLMQYFKWKRGRWVVAS